MDYKLTAKLPIDISSNASKSQPSSEEHHHGQACKLLYSCCSRRHRSHCSKSYFSFYTHYYSSVYCFRKPNYGALLMLEYKCLYQFHFLETLTNYCLNDFNFHSGDIPLIVSVDDASATNASKSSRFYSIFQEFLCEHHYDTKVSNLYRMLNPIRTNEALQTVVVC